MADAWHHRSDSLSSIGAFAGILGARLGFPVLDPLASIIICIFIGKASWDIFHDAMNKMVDKSCDDRTIQDMRQSVLGKPWGSKDWMKENQNVWRKGLCGYRNCCGWESDIK